MLGKAKKSNDLLLYSSLSCSSKSSITGRDKISNSRSNSDNIKFSCYDLHNRNTHRKNKIVPTFYNFFIWSYVRSANGKNRSCHTHKERPNFKWLIFNLFSSIRAQTKSIYFGYKRSKNTKFTDKKE